MCIKSILRNRYAVTFAAVSVAVYALRPPPAEPDDFASIAARRGYRSARHDVTTDDGYVLTIFRINGKQCQGKLRRTPVYLMHGMLLSAESWLAAGPAAGLGYLLPDACHDTWAGSARGSPHGKRHRRHHPAERAFWRFSADEMASHDVPAAIDYILAATGAERVNYVGFSQGGSLALMMLSERPEYASKLGVVVALAPPTTTAGMTSPAFRWLLRTSEMLEGPLASVGVHEALAAGSAAQWLAERACAVRAVRDFLCKGLLSLIDAAHPGSIADETYSTLFRHFPAGTSVRTMARYGQILKAKAFQKYDFGERENLKKYGSARPPAYDPRRVSAPVLLVASAGDRLVGVEEAQWLAGRLPQLQELFVVDDPLWVHLDSLYSKNINGSLFPKINQYLLKYNAP